ncbi:MAG: segregation/condensation protein A [Mycoplasmoidaceae bacterium]
MQKNKSISDAREFIVKIDDFNGPINFLYQLIVEKKKNILDIDVLDISIAFSNYVHKYINDMSIDFITENLLIMTYMIELKSKKIIPVYTNKKNIELDIERDKFIQKILMYKKIKNIIPFFETKMNERKLMIGKENELKKFYQEEKTIERIPDFISPEKLLIAIQDVYKNINNREKIQKAVSIEIKELSIEDITSDVLIILKNYKFSKISLNDLLLSVPHEKLSKQYFAVCFLVILVLTRNGLINLEQDEDDIISINILFEKSNLEGEE